MTDYKCRGICYKSRGLSPYMNGVYCNSLGENSPLKGRIYYKSELEYIEDTVVLDSALSDSYENHMVIYPVLTARNVYGLHFSHIVNPHPYFSHAPSSTMTLSVSGGMVRGIFIHILSSVNIRGMGMGMPHPSHRW